MMIEKLESKDAEVIVAGENWNLADKQVSDMHDKFFRMPPPL